MSLQSLDDTAIQALIEVMPIHSIMALCSTNTNFKRICDDGNSRLWFLLMQQDFPDYLMDSKYASYKIAYTYLKSKRDAALAILNNRSSDEIINLPKSILYAIDFQLFHNPDMMHSNLSGADLSHTLFRTDVSMEKYLYLDSSNFNNTILNYAKFENVGLENCTFVNASLINVKFINYKLYNTSFNDANLQNADFSTDGVQYQNDVSFVNANLTNVNFMGVNFRVAHFTNADMRGIQTNSDTVFAYCTFQYSILSGIKFQNINFTNSDFMHAICNETVFKECNLTNCNFYKADITDADFTDSNLTNTKFTPEISDYE